MAESSDNMDTGSDSPPSCDDFSKTTASPQSPDDANKNIKIIKMDNEKFSKYRDTKYMSEDGETEHRRLTLHDSPQQENGCLNDSLTAHMSKLTLNNDSPRTPKLTCTLEHPLMAEEDYPDLVPEKRNERFEESRNDSKNNLYLSECSAEDCKTPDVVKVRDVMEERERREVAVKFENGLDESCAKTNGSPRRVLGRPMDNSTPTLAENVTRYMTERRRRRERQREKSEERDGTSKHASQIGSHSTQTSWPDSLPQHSVSNGELPSETSSERRAHQSSGCPHQSVENASGQHSQSSRRRVIVPQLTDERLSLGSSVESLPTEGERRGSTSDEDSSRNTGSECSESIAEYSREEERERERSVKRVALPTGGHAICDMRVISPFKRVLSHGGYAPDGTHIIVMSACYLPDTKRIDYNYVIENLFLYVLWTLARLVTDEYLLVYLHGGARRLPGLPCLTQAYKLVDRRLRKNLKKLYLVHPTFWLRSIVFMSRPFISPKFYRKLHYVYSLTELYSLVDVERAAIPAPVVEHDERRRQRR